MENATKALLIAAAILIAIIIISLGIMVVRQGQEAMTGADMSDTEKYAFNNQWEKYSDKKVSASDVKTLVSSVYSNNQNDNNPKITLNKDGSTIVNSTPADTFPNVSTDPSKKYVISINYNDNGYVNQIDITTK